MDYRELLRKAEREHTLDEGEVKAIVDELMSRDSRVDKHTLLQALLESRAPESASIAERFLQYRQDPMVAALALQGLYLYYPDRVAAHLPDIETFLDGVDWDDEQDVRLMAMSAAGKFLQSHQNAELLGKMIRIAEDRGEDPVARTSALFALGRALDDEWAKTSGFSTQILDDTGFVETILARAKDKLPENGEA